MRSTRPRALALALLGAAAAGCRAPRPPQHDLDVELAERWSTDAPAGAVVGGWIATFGDAHLGALVGEALEHNRDLRAARARLERAAAQATLAGADRLPSAGLNVGAQRQKQNFVGLGDAFGVPGGGVPSATFSSFGVSLDVRWEADVWGRLDARAGAAEAEYSAAAADLHGARLSLAGQTAKAWFSLTEARLQRELARRTTESYARSTEVVRQRYEAGLRSGLDLHLARGEAAAAARLLAQREARLDAVRRQLEILLGRYPAGELEATADLPPLPPAVPAGLPSELLARRPDLRAAASRLAAADLRVSEAEAARLPRLALTASGGTSSDEVGDLLDEDFSVWSLAASLFQPLFEGGRLDARVDAREAESRIRLEEWATAVLGAFGETESALAAERHRAEEERQARIAMEEAAAARRMAEEQYRSGLTDVTTLLDAQRSALTGESQWLAARRARLETRVDLHLALGGDFEGAAAAGVRP